VRGEPCLISSVTAVSTLLILGGIKNDVIDDEGVMV
jgi:hypothetical protein